MQKLITVFIFLFIGLSANAQFRFPAKEQNKIDSLYKVVQNTNYDTTLASAYAQLASIFYDNDLDSNAKYSEKAITIAEKGLSEATNPQIIKSFSTSLAWGFISKAIVTFYSGNIKSATEYNDRCSMLAEELDIKILIAHGFGISTSVFMLQGEILKAIDNVKEALTIYKEINARKWIGSCYYFLGVLYYSQGDIMNSLDHLKIGLKFSEETDDKANISMIFFQFGTIYYALGEHSSALEYCNKALKIAIELNDKFLIYQSLLQLSILDSELSNFSSANDNLHKTLKLSEELESPMWMGQTYLLLAKNHKSLGDTATSIKYIDTAFNLRYKINNSILFLKIMLKKGGILFEQNKLVEAKKIGLKCLKNAQSFGIPSLIEKSAQLLNNVYKKEKNWQKANEMHELYIIMRDSVKSQENQKAIIQIKYQEEYEKYKLEDSLNHAKEIANQKAEGDLVESELDKEKTHRIALYIGIAFILAFLVFIFNRFRISQKQKGIIEKKHHKLDESHSELKDSITYAKRLQEAILPSKKMVKEWLPQSFILYKPKDIIAGDFYWMETHKDWIYFAAADCTGHGVPGAMVSVVCSNVLSKALIEESRTKPAEILNRARELVIERFGRSENEIKDGMDISLCAYNQQSGQLQWAGANNPLWIIRAGSEVIEEIKADRQPIGRFSFKTPFNNHEIQLNKGDSLYIFTDGFCDQFGGKKGKKYKVENLKSFLLSIQKEGMETQCSLLNKEFVSWQGTFEQLDDVCLMGVKV